MRLLPAILFILALFFAGSIIVNLRKASKQGLRTTDSYKKKKKRLFFIVTLMLVILSGFLLKFMGKVAMLVAAVLFLIFLINNRRL